MRVNVLHLRSFYAIATEGSINQAARRLRVSQSTLSKQLKSLEERHQIALFRNRTPPLHLTSVGEALLVEVRRLIASVDVIEQFLEKDSINEIQMVRMGSDTPPLAARLARDLKTAFGTLSVNVRIENARETFELLRTGQIDLAIVTDPPVHPQFHYIPVLEDVLVAALPRDHPAASTECFDIYAICTETLLMREATSRTRTSINWLLSELNIVPGDVQELHTRETIREAIALNMGVSFFFSGECPPDPRIVYRPIAASVTIPTILAYLIYLNDRRNHPVTRKAAEQVLLWTPKPRLAWSAGSI